VKGTFGKGLVINDLFYLTPGAPAGFNGYAAGEAFKLGRLHTHVFLQALFQDALFCLGTCFT